MKGYNVAVVDHDDLQPGIHGLPNMRQHSSAGHHFRGSRVRPFRKIKKNALSRVIASNAVNALDDAEGMIAAEVWREADVVFLRHAGVTPGNGVMGQLSTDGLRTSRP